MHLDWPKLNVILAWQTDSGCISHCFLLGGFGMPVIDRYLEVIQKQRAESLVFAVGAPVEMVIDGQSRSVSSKPATMEQIHAILTEIIPDYPAQLLTGPVTCPHSSVYGNFSLHIEQTGGRSMPSYSACNSSTFSISSSSPSNDICCLSHPACSS